MEQRRYDEMRLVSTLMKVGHGDLTLFIEHGLPAAEWDPELFGHFVAWNHKNGKVKDSKVAYPVIALRGLGKMDDDLVENALAHMASLGPRELLRAYQFNSLLVKRGVRIPAGNRRYLEGMLRQYLKVREAKPDWWDSAVVRNRKAMTALYAVSHTPPNARAQAVLFDKQYPAGSVFEKIANLKLMSPKEAAGTILEYKIPLPVAIGAVAKAKDPNVVLALIEQSSGNELLNNTDMFKRLGVFEDPALRAAFENAVERARTDKRVNVLKAQKAAEKVIDVKIADKLHKVQQSQLEQLGTIEGSWLVLGDKSDSMGQSIDIAKQMAALIAERVKENVYLVFFNHMPEFHDATGKTLDQIEAETRRIFANGRTSIGCGLEYIRERGLVVNGIVVVTDGGDNTDPYFHYAYKRYTNQLGIEPTVYQLLVRGYSPDDMSRLCDLNDIQVEQYDLRDGVDYYSLPNIVKALKTRRYGLLDEIRETPLLTLAEVFGE